MHKTDENSFPVTKLDKEGKIIGETNRQSIRFRREEFLNALSSASCVLGKEDNAVAMTVKNKLATGQFVVEMLGLNRFTKAQSTEKVLAESTIGSALTIGIHYQKVRECLRLFNADNFTMYVLGPSDPIFLVEEGVKDFVSISVPLRIS